MASVSLLTHARNIVYIDAKATSSAGSVAKNQFKRYIDIYINVGANNNNNSSNNSRMHEISTIPIRKALRITACRASRLYVNIGVNNNNDLFQ